MRLGLTPILPAAGPPAIVARIWTPGPASSTQGADEHRVQRLAVIEARKDDVGFERLDLAAECIATRR